VQDVDNNGSLSFSTDAIHRSVTQDYFGGLSNSFKYKGWQLDIFFQFVKQNGYSYLYYAQGIPGTFNVNQPIYVLDRWQKAGDQSSVQKFSTSGPANDAFNNGVYSGDGSIVDASFIRLKNASLSYTLPLAWQHALGLQRARIYLEGQNLLTITGYKGVDPETQGLNLPPLRMISLGIMASF
jgi:hypothetical protein